MFSSQATPCSITDGAQPPEPAFIPDFLTRITLMPFDDAATFVADELNSECPISDGPTHLEKLLKQFIEAGGADGLINDSKRLTAFLANFEYAVKCAADSDDALYAYEDAR